MKRSEAVNQLRNALNSYFHLEEENFFDGTSAGILMSFIEEHIGMQPPRINHDKDAIWDDRLFGWDKEDV